MKNVVEDEIVKELSEQYNKRQVFIKLLIRICLDLKINNPNKEIENFFKINEKN